MQGIRTIVLGLAIGFAIGSSQKQSLPDGVLHFPLVREEPSTETLQRRDNAEVHVSETASSYVVELTIGPDEQKVTVLVDSGSNDLWVMDSENPRCYSIVNGSNTIYPNHPDNLYGVECNAAFMFSSGKSTPSGDGLFSIQPDHYHFAEGYYTQDTVQVGGIRIENATFGVATESSIVKSMFGIGLGPANGSSLSRGNLLAQMKEKGVIKANAYSSWLDSTGKGSLLLGGVDHSRYTGTLETVPLIRDKPGMKEPTEFKILLSEIAAYQNDRSATIVECSLPALLIIGENPMMLPNALFAAVIESINAMEIEGSFFIPCELEGGLTFDFSGIKINLPFTKLAKPDAGFTDLCKLDIVGGGPTVSLSSSFLSSAFVVFDIDHNEIALAKQAHNISDSSLPSVEAITSKIPGASQAISYSETQMIGFVKTSRASVIEYPMTSDYSGSTSNRLSQSSKSFTSDPQSLRKGSGNNLAVPTVTYTAAVRLTSISDPSRSISGSSSKPQPPIHSTVTMSKESDKNIAHNTHGPNTALGVCILGTLGLALVL